MLHLSFLREHALVMVMCPRSHHQYAFSSLLHNDHGIHMPNRLPCALCQNGLWQRVIPHNCSNAVDKASSVPTRWPLENAVQAEGSFAFSRIVVRSSGCSLRIHRLVRSCTEERSPGARTVQCYRTNGGDWGEEIPCEHPHGVMAAFGFCFPPPTTFPQALSMPPSVARKQPAACGQPLRGGRSSHGP